MALEASIATGFGRVACGKILCADIEPSSSSKLQTTSHLDQSADLEIYTFCLWEWSNFQPSTKFLWLFHCRMCEIEVFNKKCDSAMFLNMVPIIFSAWQKMSSINNEVMFGPRRTWLNYPCLRDQNVWDFNQNQIWTRRGPFSADSGVRRLYLRVWHRVGPLSRATDSTRSIKTDWVHKIVWWEDLARTGLWVGITRRTL